jgi:hypothetical protein
MSDEAIKIVAQFISGDTLTGNGNDQSIPSKLSMIAGTQIP